MNDIKVLEVNVNDHSYNGVFSLIKNVVLNKPRSIQIDIASFEKFENSKNIEILNQNGCKVFYLGDKGNKFQQPRIRYKNLYKFLCQNNYDYVHIHSDVADKLLILGLAAKKAGHNKIIYHSHAANVDGRYRWIKRIIHHTCAPFLKRIGTEYVAVSGLAAKWMYPNISSAKVKIIKNGIDLSKYKYNSAVRRKVRESLGLKDNLVIGNIGRFAYQKNHRFMIKMFYDLQSQCPEARLLLVGEGKDKPKIQELVNRLNISKKVIFYGVSNNVEKLLQAMDIFILPSHFEGLPIVGVEAQAAGLPVIFSNKITREARILNTTKYLGIKSRNIPSWIKSIKKDKNIERQDSYKECKLSGFGISDSVKQFMELYGK